MIEGGCAGTALRRCGKNSPFAPPADTGVGGGPGAPPPCWTLLPLIAPVPHANKRNLPTTQPECALTNNRYNPPLTTGHRSSVIEQGAVDYAQRVRTCSEQENSYASNLNGSCCEPTQWLHPSCFPSLPKELEGEPQKEQKTLDLSIYAIAIGQAAGCLPCALLGEPQLSFQRRLF